MKLEYKILWLDDKINEFIEDGFIEEVEQHLIDNNFIPKIITVSKTKDFFDNIDFSYDLILTDYHLNNDENGEKVIKQLRATSVMTEVLFYTAKADLTDAKKIDRVSFLETGRKVGNEHIENVIEKAIELIDLTIKKFQHIVTMRGMIMHETSVLDELAFDIITDYLTKTDDADVKKSIFDEIISFYERKFNVVTKLKKNERIDKVIKDPLLFSFSQRANTLSSIINQNGFDNFIDDFKDSVIKVRNQFAHAVLEKDKNGNEFFRNKSEDIIFDDGLCKKIREDIIEHKKNLDKLKEQLRK